MEVHFLCIVEGRMGCWRRLEIAIGVQQKKMDKAGLIPLVLGLPVLLGAHIPGDYIIGSEYHDQLVRKCSIVSPTLCAHIHSLPLKCSL